MRDDSSPPCVHPHPTLVAEIGNQGHGLWSRLCAFPIGASSTEGTNALPEETLEQQRGHHVKAASQVRVVIIIRGDQPMKLVVDMKTVSYVRK